jgi:hypothetical protein
MDAHNVSALCVESLFHTSEERTKEIDLGALADLPDTLRVIRDMASVGTESTLYELRLLQQKVTDLEAIVRNTGIGAASNTDAPVPGPAQSGARFSAAAAPSSS